jgi:iron complex transport system ATP-binding protein
VTTSAPTSTLALELVRISARYDAIPGAGAPEASALLDVSLSVAPGEIVVVIGPNGAGKSTLLRVMAGTLRPSSGEALLFGATLAGHDRQRVARDVAFVAQSEEVRFAFSVRDVVLMGRAPHQEGWMRPTNEDARVVADVLRRMDLEGLADRAVEQLSGGERKRVAIARAFAQASRVLLLDEPTAFLDVRHQVALFEELRELGRARGTASVVVTHDLQLAAAHGSRVALIKAGRLVADGTVDEVLTEARLGETFDWPIRAGRVEGTGERVFVPQRG